MATGANPWEPGYWNQQAPQQAANPWEPGYWQQDEPQGNAFVGSTGPQPERGEFRKAVASGTDNMQGMAYGFAALVGDSVGHEGLTQWGLDNYQRNQEEAARNAPRVGSFRDIENTEDFFDYTAGVLGQTLPFTLTTIGGGGIGGLVARSVGKRMLAKGISEKLTKESVERILKDETKRAALNRMVKRGAMTGSFAGSATTQQGGLYGELKEAGVDDAELPAWIGGAVMGGLDVLPEVFLFNKVFSPAKVASELNESIARGVAGKVKEAGKVAGQQSLAEGITEGLQETTAILTRAIADENFKWDDKANERVLDAVVAGGIAGLFLGGGAGGLKELIGRKEQEKKDGQQAKPDTGGDRAGTPPAGGNGGTGAVPNVAAGDGRASGNDGVQPPAVSPAAGEQREVAPTTPAAPAAPSNMGGTPASGKSEWQQELERKLREAAQARLQSPTAPDPRFGGTALAATPTETPAAPQQPTATEAQGTLVQRLQKIAQERLQNPPAPDPRFGGQAPAKAQTTDAPSAEPLSHLRAQLRDTRNPTKARKATYLSAANVAAHGEAIKPQTGGLVAVEDADGKGGVLYAKPEDARAFVQRKQAGEDLNALIGEFTNADPLQQGGKPETDNPVAVQQRDAEGNVTAETLVDGNQPQAVAAAETAYSEPGSSVTTATPESVIVERETKLAQEPATPVPTLPTEQALAVGDVTDVSQVSFDALRDVAQMRRFLASNPPFLGDLTEMDAETRERMLPYRKLFHSWLKGKAGPKPGRAVREAYEQWVEARAGERPVVANDFTFDLTAPEDAADDRVVPVAQFTREQRALGAAIAPELARWRTKAATQVLFTLATQPQRFNQIAESARSMDPRRAAMLAVAEVLGSAEASTFMQAMEELDGRLDRRGNVSHYEFDERETNELTEREVDLANSLLIGQDNITDGVRLPVSKDERAKGKIEESVAKPWQASLSAVELADALTEIDPGVEYAAYKITKQNFRSKFGLDSLPAGGEGWYVVATPTMDAETYYSTLLGKQVSLKQAINVFGMRAKRRARNLPQKLKGADAKYRYTILATNEDGETVELAVRDIVDLGYFADPTLRAMRDSSRDTANFYALLHGLSLMDDADLTGLNLNYRSGNGLNLPGNLVLEHRKGGSRRTLTHAVADAMFTKEELQAAYDAAVAAAQKRVGRRTLKPEEAYAVGERGRLRFIKENYAARFAAARKQAEALLQLGAATGRAPRQQTQRATAAAARLDEIERRLIEASAAYEALAAKDSKNQRVRLRLRAAEREIARLKAEFAKLSRREMAPGFEMQNLLSEYGDLARELYELGIQEPAFENLIPVDTNVQGQNPIDSPDNGGNFAGLETEEQQIARSSSLGNLTPTQSFVKPGRGGNSAIGTFAANGAPGLLGNSPTEAPTTTPTDPNQRVSMTQQVWEQQTDPETGRPVLVPTGETREIQPTLAEAAVINAGIGTAMNPNPKPLTDPEAVGPPGYLAPSMPAAPAVEARPPESGPRSPAPAPTPVAPSQFTNGVSVIFKDPARGTLAQRIATKLRELLKLSSNIIVVDSHEEAVRQAQLHGFDVALVDRGARDTGQRGTVFRINGVSLIVMQPANTKRESHFVKSLAHEVGHVFYFEQYNKAPDRLRKMLNGAYSEYMKSKAGKAHAELRRARGGRYNMDEWIADQVAAWAVTNKKARTELERFFDALATTLMEVWQYMKQHYGIDETAQQFINASIAGQRDTSLDPTLESLGSANDHSFDMNVSDDLAATADTWQRALWSKAQAFKANHPTLAGMAETLIKGVKGAHEVFLSRVFVRVERMNIDAFNQIMRHFYQSVGEGALRVRGAIASTFFSDVDGRFQAFSLKYRRITADMSEADKTRLMGEALREAPIPPGHPQAQKLQALRDLLQEAYAYAREAGLPIQRVDNYFPQVYDRETITTPEAAVEIAAALQAAGVRDPVRRQPYTAEQVQAMFDGMLDDSTMFAVDPNDLLDADVTAPASRAPSAQALRMRVIPVEVRRVINAIPDENGRPKYMAKSLDYVLATYFKQLTMRAEFNRRLGDKDFLQRLAEWEALPDDQRAQAPRPKFDAQKELKRLLQLGAQQAAQQNDGNGTVADKVNFMQDVVSAMLGQYGRIQSPALRKLNNAMMLYQNLRTLMFVVFASFPDMANIFIRTGEFKQTFAVMRRTAKAALKGELNETLRMYGHAADALDATMMRDLVELRDGETRVWKWNEAFFRAVQLHRWTNFVRGMGLEVSKDYIKRHANLAAEGNEDSMRRLEELGLTPEHVAEWVQEGEGSYFVTENPSEGTHRVTAAIQRMVNDMVIHPTAPEKTLWGNAEHFKLLWHLKSFMYGFSTRVLGRAYHEVTREGATAAQQLAVLGGLALFLPLAAFGLMLRDLLQYWVWGRESYTPYDDPLKYMWHLAGRSGITGFGQLAVDTLSAADRGRAPLLAWAGPTVTQMNDFLEYPLYKTLPGAIPGLASFPGAREWVRETVKEAGE